MDPSGFANPNNGAANPGNNGFVDPRLVKLQPPSSYGQPTFPYGNPQHFQYGNFDNVGLHAQGQMPFQQGLNYQGYGNLNQPPARQPTRDAAAPQMPANQPEGSAAPSAPAPGTVGELKESLKVKSHVYRGMLKDCDHAMRMRRNFMTLNNKEPGPCQDFPPDSQSQKRLVQRLFEAIMDFDDMIDGQRLKRTRSEAESEDQRTFVDSHQVERIKNMSDIEVEILAWDILKNIREAQEGKLMFAPWSKDFAYAKFDNFMARFESVVMALKKSKAVVAGITAAPHIRRVAAHPEREFKRKGTNKAQNKDRDAQVKIGNHYLKNAKVRVDEAKGIVDETGIQICPAGPENSSLIETAERLAKRQRRSAQRDVTPGNQALNDQRAESSTTEHATPNTANPMSTGSTTLPAGSETGGAQSSAPIEAHPALIPSIEDPVDLDLLFSPLPADASELAVNMTDRAFSTTGGYDDYSFGLDSLNYDFAGEDFQALMAENEELMRKWMPAPEDGEP